MISLHGRKRALLTMASMLLVLVALTVSLTTRPASAQQEPTPTPSSPVWLGFSAAREAVEEREDVDLSLLQNWTFQQDDWSFPHPQRDDRASGIDSCDTSVGIFNARPIYFGFTYTITDLRGNNYEVRVSFDRDAVVICDLPSVQAPPTPTPVPQPEATDEAGAPITGGEVGAPVVEAGAAATGGFELGAHVDGLPQGVADTLRGVGMTWIKKQVRTEWGVETGLSLIQDAQSKGFRVLLGVVGDKNALGANFDAYMAEYNSFVSQLAAAGADAIEVWNEPNIDREWPVGQISGENYTRMLASAYNAIKAANPNTIVISGAPAPTGFFGAAGCTAQGCNDDVFMQQMAAAGAAQYMDCVGLHYNEGIVSPTQNSGDPRGSYPTYFFGSMLARGYNPFGGIPVCWTELGYLSPEGMGAPLPGAFGWAQNTSVAQHAAWLAEAATLSAQSGNVRIMIVWNANFTRWDSDPMGGYAMFRPDGSCPACDTLRQAMGR